MNVILVGIVLLSLGGVAAIVVIALNTQDGISASVIGTILGFLAPTIAALVAAVAAHQAVHLGQANADRLDAISATQNQQAKT